MVMMVVMVVVLIVRCCVTNYPQNLMAQNNTFIISWFCRLRIQGQQGCDLPCSLPRRRMCF